MLINLLGLTGLRHDCKSGVLFMAKWYMFISSYSYTIKQVKRQYDL